MDPYYDDGDESVVGSSEYPDPDYTPRFAWVGAQDLSLLEEEVEDVHEENELSLPNRSMSSDVLDHPDNYTPLGPQTNTNDLSVDPDFDYRDDEEISDDIMSEADSDLDGTNPGFHKGQLHDMGDFQGDNIHHDAGIGVPRTRGRGKRGRPIGHGRGGKGIKRGIRRPLEPSQAFKDLHSKATMAFIHQDYTTAEGFAKQAIQENPEIFAAYSLLAEIHMARDDKSRAMQALFNGAHTRATDTEVWRKVAKLIMEVAGDDRKSGIPDAIYCYNQIIQVTRADVEARLERAALHREAGSTKRAIYDYVRSLQELPHDTGILRHLADLFIESGRLPEALRYYDEAILHHQSIQANALPAFTWSDLNIYAELLTHFTDLAAIRIGLGKVKCVCRWLLGRKDETFWDEYTSDDREFDARDEPRRSHAQGFVAGRYDIGAYGEDLPLELRVKLGLFRLSTGNDGLDEAMKHFDWLEPMSNEPGSKLFDFPDLFREVADALMSRRLWREALRFYEPLQMVEEYTDLSYYHDLGSCYRSLAMVDEAEECFRVIVENDDENTAAWIQLATMFENANMPDRAAPYVNKIGALRQGNASRKRQHQNTIESGSTAIIGLGTQSMLLSRDAELPTAKLQVRKSKEKPSKKPLDAKKMEKIQRKERVQGLYFELRSLNELIQSGSAEARSKWIDASEPIINEFKSNKAFFNTDRGAKIPGYSGASSVRNTKSSQVVDDTAMTTELSAFSNEGLANEETSISNQYCGISFEKWLDIFLQYAIFVAEDGTIGVSYEILTTATNVNVFYQSKESMFLIHVAWFTCALIANDGATLCTVSRYFMKEYQFITDSYRLYSALNRLCNRPNTCYNGAPSQKYLLRQIKAMDFSLVAEQRQKKLYDERASYTTKDEKGNPILAEQMDIGLIMLYGHVMYAGGGHVEALNYFYRAYALDPCHPMINLSLALTYLHYALNRQSENRHYLIVQGLSFLYSYYDLQRGSDSSMERQECEFNVGRAYHMLGLTNLATPYYERCLDISEEARKNGEEGNIEDYGIEAAIALQGLWAANDQMELAQNITEKWLIL